MIKKLPAVIVLFHLFLQTAIAVEPTKPKYGPSQAPKAIPLPLSNSYFRNPKNTAGSFWSLISYYMPQSTHASCSSATLTMAINAARAQRKESAEDRILTEADLLDQIQIDHWKERLNKGGFQGKYGVNIDQLGKITETAFKKYDFPNASIKVIHFNPKSPSAKKELIQNLKSISSTTFLLANFNQKNFTDDADVGHFAPVGAYDDTQNQVLILDPDREYYVPYWVSLDTFMEGMNTQDSSTQATRGYIMIHTQ